MDFTNVEHLLPEAVQALITLIGLPAVVRLVEQLGGTTFPVALRKSRLGEIRYEALSEVVGSDAADAITKHFGGEALYIPRCVAALREVMHRHIRRDFDSMTREHSAIHVVNQLALRYRMSDRHVWRVLKRPDMQAQPPPKQDNLF
ncbi:Mor transcription activator family protein [Paraburkholderia sp.]|uniref:Mor transcription activator family protein n=1 Tax=Paraburkholderia sp. TaxID=1926495 RepID=UPI002D37F124|nr:Mor transcription activator family protein [Paraburkholderia sp.]HZZ04619.1 Mor transcription activator family protein [Paraburkholderia sp.]